MLWGGPAPSRGSSARRPCLAVDETVMLLHPPSTFTSCFNSDGERASAKLAVSPTATLATVAAQRLGVRRRALGALSERRLRQAEVGVLDGRQPQALELRLHRLPPVHARPAVAHSYARDSP